MYTSAAVLLLKGLTHLQLVDRSYNVDTIVDDVGDGGVDLTVECQQSKATQIKHSGSLQFQ